MYPEIGSRWIHYKTRGIYKVTAVGKFTEDPSEVCVVYQSEVDGKTWIRPFQPRDIHDTRSCWDDYINVYTKRFSPVVNSHQT